VSSRKEPRWNPGRERRIAPRFIRGVGLGSGALGAGVLQSEALAQAPAAAVVGPGAVAITLKVNGKEHPLSVEPRLTLLDALRDRWTTREPRRFATARSAGPAR